MTVYIDPVIGAALVHLGLPILPALPCPECGGRDGRHVNGPGGEDCGCRRCEPCPDCTDGVWTPPEHPVPIGVTSARPEVGAHDGYIVCSVIPKGYVPDYEADDDDIVVAPGRGLMTNDEWAHKFDDIKNMTPPHPIVLSSMIGEGTLRKLKVIDGERLDQDLTPELVCIDRLGLSHYGPLLSNCRDISSALPFFPGLKPGDTVYLLDGFTEAISCAECDGWMCKRCSGTGWERPCPFPVDAPDHRCVTP